MFRSQSYTDCRKRRRGLLHPLQLDVFYALWGGAHHRVSHRPRPRLVLAEKERVAKGNEKFQPIDVLCLNKSRRAWKRNINYIGRPGSASTRTARHLRSDWVKKWTTQTRGGFLGGAGESKVSSRIARRLRSGWIGNWTAQKLNKGLGRVRTSPPKTAQNLLIGGAGATEGPEWTNRLPDKAILSAGLRHRSRGATRERTAPNPDDAASLEGLGQGNGGAGPDEIDCARTTRLLRPSQARGNGEAEGDKTTHAMTALPHRTV